MSVLRPRNRLVYFRVSEDEYQQYNNICESTGSRSISDLARSAMQRIVQNGNGTGEERISEKLSILETLVNDLNRRVCELSLRLDRPASQMPSSNRGLRQPNNDHEV
jgi:hypothetical protein